MLNIIYFLVALNLLLTITDGRIVIDDVEVGREKDYKIIADIEMKNLDDGKVSGKGTVFLMVDFTDDSEFFCQVFTVRNGKERKLVEKRGKGSCTAINTYMGSFWEDIQKKAGIANPGECPVPKGNYTIKDFIAMDLSKMQAAKAMPKGTVRTSCRLFDTDGKTVLGSIGATITKS